MDLLSIPRRAGTLDYYCMGCAGGRLTFERQAIILAPEYHDKSCVKRGGRGSEGFRAFTVELRIADAAAR